MSRSLRRTRRTIEYYNAIRNSSIHGQGMDIFRSQWNLAQRVSSLISNSTKFPSMIDILGVQQQPELQHWVSMSRDSHPVVKKYQQKCKLSEFSISNLVRINSYNYCCDSLDVDYCLLIFSKIKIQITSYHVILYHIISYNIIHYHTISHHSISQHITSSHITPHII